MNLPLSGDPDGNGKDLSDFLALNEPEALRDLLDEASKQGPFTTNGLLDKKRQNHDLRQIDEILSVILRLIGWHQEFVDKMVINKFSTQCTGVTQKMCLNRRRPARHDLKAISRRGSSEIDKNINVIGPNSLDNFIIAFRSNIVKFVDRLFYSASDRTLVIATI